jgi:hypothetical protein
MQRQLELPISRKREDDRNLSRGGRSFYFFDFDDNIAFLTTPLILFHKDTGREIAISSAEYAQEHSHIGKSGVFKDYFIDYDDSRGTFRCFRDHDDDQLKKLGYKDQVFVQDIVHALGFPDLQWKGPSWSCFYHATFNQRPVSVITARGHQPETIRQGIDQFVHLNFLTQSPLFLSVFPVSHIPTRIDLGDGELKLSVAELKQRAIRASVLKAFSVYGYNPHHRFGMSDDDPKNILLISEEMTRLKSEFPEVSFFVIETQKGEFVKHEVLLSGTQSQKIDSLPNQIKLF